MKKIKEGNAMYLTFEKILVQFPKLSEKKNQHMIHNRT
jgi:hypothetical protein